MDQDTVFAIVMWASFPVWMGIIWFVARSHGRHWAWSLCGFGQLIGLLFVLAWFYLIKPSGRAPDLQTMYARGEISEEEYRRAMTSGDRAA
ncbi:MAG: SHOCT domain-containing protein [Tepidiformaceae bacterium]